MRHWVEGKAGSAFLALHCSWIPNFIQRKFEKQIKSELNSKVWCMCMQVRTLVYCQYTVGAWEKRIHNECHAYIALAGHTYVRSMHSVFLCISSL